MHQSADKETHRSQAYPATLVASSNQGESKSEGKRQSTAAADHRNREQTPTISESVAGYIERNPVVAAGAALAVGAAVVMALQSRRAASNRIDRRVQRAVRSMDRSFAREMKALRRSDMADRVSHFGSSLGDVFSRIDLSPLAERGQVYLDAARRRMGV
ncbi:MAG: hypothetical protein AB7L90_06860 [Hyphomicrobiaceae bacterium]